jgi:hypothetical protein
MRTLEQSPVKMKKGRSADLIKLRDERLVRRFYYWYETKRLRYDDVLNKLSTEEFFISETRIETIITENQSLLDSLFEAKGKLIASN